MFFTEAYREDIKKHQKQIVGGIVEEHRLIALAKTGDQKAIDALVCSCLLYIVTQVKRFMKNNTDPEELFNAGVIGAIEGINKFDLTVKVEFLTYGSKWIVAKISDYVHKDDTIQLPANIVAELQRQKKLIRLNKAHLIPEGKRIIHNISSLSEKSSDENDNREIEDKIGYEEPITADREIKKQIAEYLNSIRDPLNRKILELLYGLNGEIEHTEEDVARKMKRTKQLISQRKLEALSQIRKKYNVEKKAQVLVKIPEPVVKHPVVKLIITEVKDTSPRRSCGCVTSFLDLPICPKCGKKQ